METLIRLIADTIGVEYTDLSLAVSIVSMTFTIAVTLFVPVLFLFLYFKKRSPDHITFSMNEICDEGDGSVLLRIRTVQHLPRTDILPSNPILNFKLALAQLRCNKNNPFLLLGKHDMDLLQPPIISTFSSLFAEGILAEQAGLPIVRAGYLLAVTYEKYNNGKAFKTHVMVVREEDLEKFSDPEYCRKIRFERAHHADRLKTLRLMAEKRKHELATTSVDGVRAIRVAEGVFRK